MAASAQSASMNAPGSGDMDPISQFKVLITHLKESLSHVMKVAAQACYQNAQVDSLKSCDASSQRIDKSLEEFYAVCDQIELNLRLALECHHQSVDNMKNSPIQIQGHLTKTDGQQQAQDSQSYLQYLSTVKLQINHAKEIHDTLLECSKRISERQMPTMQHQMQAHPTSQSMQLPGPSPMQTQ